MAFSANVTEQIDSGGKTVGQVNTYSGDGRISVEATVPDATTDQLVAMSLDVSQIKTIYIVSTTALTFETNNAATPADSIALIAGVPYIWSTGGYFTNLITTDITAVYLTNASGSAATFNLEAIYDATV